jgi:hypothetical protein
VAVRARSVLLRAPTNVLVRTAKPCGPGIPVLMPRAMRKHCRGRDDAFASRDDGGNEAGPRGERGVRRKAIAQGMPVVRLILW